jgi:hypothetical protein
MVDVERPEVRSHADRQVAKRLEAASWGAFFVWVGVALLIGASIGVGLLGVGVVVLAAQVFRTAFGLRREGFWIFVGLAFLVTGAWRVLGVEMPLAPVLLIAVGVLFLVAALRRRG